VKEHSEVYCIVKAASEVLTYAKDAGKQLGVSDLEVSSYLRVHLQSPFREAYNTVALMFVLVYSPPSFERSSNTVALVFVFIYSPPSFERSSCKVEVR
jgi:hypothetical protein